MAAHHRPRLEHVGIAVSALEDAAALYEALLGILPYKAEAVEREGVRTHFLSAGGAKLELLEAMGEDSPVARHLEKRGQGVHHLAFEVEDIHAQLRRAREGGFTSLTEEPREGADGKLIFFLHPRDTHGVLIEFCQSRAGALPASRIPFEGGELAVYEAGDPGKVPLLMLHGAAGSVHQELEPLIRALEPHFRILALDFAGHGGSDSFPGHRFSFDLFTQNAVAALDAYDVEQAHVFGFSMGGAVALRLLLEEPGRIGRVAVHSTQVEWDSAGVDRMLKRLAVEELENQPVAEVLGRHHGDWQALFRRTAAFVRTLPELAERVPLLQEVDVPVLVSAVDRDPLFPLEAALALYRLVPQSRLTVLPGSSHRLHGVQVRSYAELLHAFFLQEAV